MLILTLKTSTLCVVSSNRSEKDQYITLRNLQSVRYDNHYKTGNYACKKLSHIALLIPLMCSSGSLIPMYLALLSVCILFTYEQ